MMASSDLIKAPVLGEPGNRLSGTALIPASVGCWYPPSVQHNDLLQVDFDRQTVSQDGLYLVEQIRAGNVVWRGCRCFAIHPAGLRFDASGDGEWMAAPPASALRVVGYVEQVFRPVRAHSAIPAVHE